MLSDHLAFSRPFRVGALRAVHPVVSWLLAGAVEAQVHEIEDATVPLVQRLQRNYSLNVYNTGRPVVQLTEHKRC